MNLCASVNTPCCWWVCVKCDSQQFIFAAFLHVLRNILLIYVVHWLHKYNKIPQNARYIHQVRYMYCSGRFVVA